MAITGDASVLAAATQHTNDRNNNQQSQLNSLSILTGQSIRSTEASLSNTIAVTTGMLSTNTATTTNTLNAAIQAQGAQLSTNIHGVDVKADAIRTDLTATQAQLGALTKTVTSTVQPQITTLQAQMTTSQQSTVSHQNQLNALSSAAAATQSLLTLTSNSLTSSHNLLTTVSSAQVATQAQVNSLGASLTNTQGVINAVSQGVVNANGQIASTQSTLAVTQAIITSASNSLTSTQGLLASTSNALTSANGQITSLQATNNALQAASTAITARSSALDAQLRCVNLGYTVDSVGNMCSTPGSFTRGYFFGDRRDTPSGWSDLPYRTVYFVKTLTTSVLQIEYVDVLGFHMLGTQSWGCRWRFCIDGCAWYGRPINSHTDTGYGWRVSSPQCHACFGYNACMLVGIQVLYGVCAHRLLQPAR
jgi:hypothetical protein